MLIHPQFDPVALAIGPLAVHWYGISYLAAFVLFIVLARRRLNHPPYAALQAQWISTPGFDEAVVTGTNLLAINASASSTSATRTELGTWLDRTIAMVNGGLTLRGRAAWAHDAQRGGTIGAAFQLAPAVSLVLRNIDPPADLALVSAAAELRWGDRWSMTAQFDSEFSNSSQTYVGTGSARYRW